MPEFTRDTTMPLPPPQREIAWQAVYRAPEQEEKALRTLFSQMLFDTPRARTVYPITIDRNIPLRAYEMVLVVDA